MSARFAAALDAAGTPKAGDTVTLTGALTNSGTVTLSDITASVPGVESVSVEIPSATIAPGTTATLSISGYVLTQADIDAGTVSFPFQAAANGPKGQETSVDESSDITLEQHPLVESVLSAHLAESEHGDAPRVGDEVVLSAAVRNPGNVTLTDVAASMAPGEPAPVGDGTLAPGADTTVEFAPYVLTQKDIDRGSVAFDLTAAGASPTGDSVSSGDHRDVALQTAASIDIEGEYTASGSSVLRPGDVVTGSFRIANTGNRTLDRAEVEQQLGTAVSCETQELQPGQVATCDTEYTVTEADAVSGSLTFTAKAAGTYTSAAATTDGATARAAAVQKPVWVFSKEITKKFVAEPAPQELAFTGTDVVMIGVPIAIVVFLLGLVLLLAARRRRTDVHGHTEE
jgi:hypothetical protein